ncbi:GNAT family N-acetyltransferase [Salinispora cortesiana]|uniref:GNAT family N-acetyltransferase n=1 Tax=Salinispora cortesiana TaxID=1305843 RepID=UPI00046FDD66|nr:GNAT family N-acetyltransferase [Salinispora cortesiana]
MSVIVTPFGPADDQAIAAAVQIGAAAAVVDMPDFPLFCPQRLIGSVRHPMPGDAPVHLLAHLDGAAAGLLTLELPQLDNTENASVELTVYPAARRRGVGRVLFDRAVELAREHGRKRLTAMTLDTVAAGAAFARTLGADSVLADVRRQLDLDQLDPAVLARLLAEAQDRAADYQVVFWQGHTPAEYQADVAYLEGRLVSDAPMGGLAWEPEQYDAERVRATEAALDARGRRRYQAGVRHRASGRLVGWTLLDVAATVDWHALQQITLVDPEHRGHRLGLLVKLENLRYLRSHEPAVRVINTFNAAANDHMIAINEQLGFRVADHWTNWQLTI